MKPASAKIRKTTELVIVKDGKVIGRLKNRRKAKKTGKHDTDKRP